MRSLNTGFTEMCTLVHDFDFDVFGVSETWLQPGTPSDNYIIPGYTMLQRDRNAESRSSEDGVESGGGVAMYIKQELMYHQHTFAAELAPGVEALCVVLKVRRRRLGLCVVYRPQNVRYTCLASLFHSLFVDLAVQVNSVICIGDTNIDLRAATSNESKYLRQLLKETNTLQLINEPTRVTATSATLLDHIIVDQLAEVKRNGVIDATSISDHRGKAQVVLWLALATSVVSHPQGAEPQEVEIIKQINRVNEDGSYTFGYEAADGSFKIETRDVMGNVKGMFGFIDETGELKKVSYTANNGTGLKATGERLTPFTTEGPTEEEVTRRPIFVLRQPNDPTRPPVIQHIPRRLGYTTTTVPSTSTTPTYGEYVKGRRTHIVLPTRTKGETTTSTPKVTEEPDDEPTQIPLRKLLTTRKPSTQGKGGNNLRRQLGGEPDAPSGDVADVYSGGAANPRYNPVQSVRSPQSSLLANLPPHVAAAIRQQQIARAAATLRPYSPEDPYSTTSPLPNRPGPGVIDEQEYPPLAIRPRPLPPVKSVYRGGDDVPTQFPFPMSSLVSLRDELMDYILRYLQFRLNGGNPYLMNPYQAPYPGPVPNIPYPSANYPAVNPNVFNPYYYPNNPYQRGVPPYQPPYNPLGYPPVGYQGVGYPGGFPQPLPFSSPNKQQAGQGYSPSQRSAPSYEQGSPASRQYSRNYEQSQLSRDSSTSYEQAETRGASQQTSYSLPPTDVLRLMLARGLATSTTTSVPVRNVQILGAASSVSSSTLPPPEEMEMQA